MCSEKWATSNWHCIFSCLLALSLNGSTQMKAVGCRFRYVSNIWYSTNFGWLTSIKVYRRQWVYCSYLNRWLCVFAILFIFPSTHNILNKIALRLQIPVKWICNSFSHYELWRWHLVACALSQYGFNDTYHFIWIVIFSRFKCFYDGIYRRLAHNGQIVSTGIMASVTIASVCMQKYKM